jgi:hypothetical protein
VPSRRTRLVLIAATLAIWSIANAVWSGSLAHRSPAGHPEAAAGHPAAGEAHPALEPPARTLALPAEAREAILAEMRVMLGSVQGALEAAAHGDTALLRTAVRPAGMALAADPALEALLPADWMGMALAVHRGFDSLPGSATDPATIAAGLGRIVAGCNGCHAVYRLAAR